jgi:DoxX-like family
LEKSTLSITESNPTPSKAALWTGWILGILPAAFLLFGSITAWSASPQVVEGMTKLGYTTRILHLLCVVEFVVAVLYLIPRTAVLGAILFTAYLGGAVASHARIFDPQWIVPVVFGIIVWAGLLLRQPRLRSLILPG